MIRLFPEIVILKAKTLRPREVSVSAQVAHSLNLGLVLKTPRPVSEIV